MPVTRPVSRPIVATVVLLLVQVPPGLPSDRPVVWPTQTFKVPDIAGGIEFTVITVVAVQPVGST